MSHRSLWKTVYLETIQKYQRGIPPGLGTVQAADYEGIKKKRASHAVSSAKTLLLKTEFDKL